MPRGRGLARPRSSYFTWCGVVCQDQVRHGSYRRADSPRGDGRRRLTPGWWTPYPAAVALKWCAALAETIRRPDVTTVYESWWWVTSYDMSEKIMELNQRAEIRRFILRGSRSCVLGLWSICLSTWVKGRTVLCNIEDNGCYYIYI